MWDAANYPSLSPYITNANAASPSLSHSHRAVNKPASRLGYYLALDFEKMLGPRGEMPADEWDEWK